MTTIRLLERASVHTGSSAIPSYTTCEASDDSRHERPRVFTLGRMLLRHFFYACQKLLHSILCFVLVVLGLDKVIRECKSEKCQKLLFA